MKKIFFLLAFAFIGKQAYSQLYMVSTADASLGNCSGGEITLIKADPLGNETMVCLNVNFHSGSFGQLTQELNSIINQGYKLIEITNPQVDNVGGNGGGLTINTNSSNTFISRGTVWYFAIPWNPSGLEEVPQTLKNLNIHPNPANTHIDVVLDYDILSYSEIVIYSAAGYVYHKEVVSNLNKNEPYRLDISRVPAGKYFITIVNDKTYTTAQKLIII